MELPSSSNEARSKLSLAKVCWKTRQSSEGRVYAPEVVARQDLVVRDVKDLGVRLSGLGFGGVERGDHVRRAAGARAAPDGHGSRVDALRRLGRPEETVGEVAGVVAKDPDHLAALQRERVVFVLEEDGAGGAHVADDLGVVPADVAAAREDEAVGDQAELPAELDGRLLDEQHIREGIIWGWVVRRILPEIVVRREDVLNHLVHSGLGYRAVTDGIEHILAKPELTARIVDGEMARHFQV